MAHEERNHLDCYGADCLCGNVAVWVVVVRQAASDGTTSAHRDHFGSDVSNIRSILASEDSQLVEVWIVRIVSDGCPWLYGSVSGFASHTAGHVDSLRTCSWGSSRKSVSRKPRIQGA